MTPLWLRAERASSGASIVCKAALAASNIA